MAALAIRGGNRSRGFEISFHIDGRRRTINLSGRRFSEKTAVELKEIVEVLIHYRDNNILKPDRRIVTWLETASPEIQRKLSDVGLIVIPDRHTLQELWDTFLKYKARHVKQNLRTTLEKIFNRAKLPMIPRPFDNFRMTRSNEVYNRWGAFKESQWIGHSSRVRADHYLMLTDADYLEASQWESKAVSTSKPKPEQERVERFF